jgi:hypothetical protein
VPCPAGRGGPGPRASHARGATRIDARAALEHMDWLAPLHDSVLLPEPGGGYVPDR